MPSTSYLRYQPLSNNRLIRLVVVKPSFSALQPIVCSLKQVSLDVDDAQRTYEALSYTWGAKEGSVPITCDGQTLHVTPNCESALRYLRNRFTERILWVDAICIDQQSVEEKNQQVPLMGEIYSLARRVVIWLGAGLSGDEAVLNKARIGGRLYYARDLPGQAVLSDREKQWAAKLISPDDIARVQRICSHEWFQRMWTMQELLLAGSAVFQLGSTECPTSALYTYFLVAESLVDAGIPQRELFQLRSRALEAVNPKSVGGAGWLISTTTTVNQTSEAEAVELLGLLTKMAAVAKASDERDKVYGMVGLLRAVFSELLLPDVDYGKSVPEIFEAFTKGCIKSTGVLWPLEIMSSAYSKSSRLPSWVPELRDPNAICIDWRPRLNRKAHHDENVLEEVDCDEPGRLPVRGYQLARVEDVFARMPVCSTDDPDGERLRTACLSEWTALAATFEEEFANSGLPSDYLSALQSLTPGLNPIRDKHEPRTGSESEEDEQRGLGWFSRRRSSDSGILTISPTHSQNQYDGAVLFRTACGLLGLCKGKVRVGDKVFQLAGGQFPFILHRVSRQKKNKYSQYRLVGITDVHGLETKEGDPAWSKEFRTDESKVILLA